MKLMDYLKAHDIEKVAKLVKTSPQYLKLVAYGHKVPSWPDMTNRIISATGGRVTTIDLRPDIVEALLNDPELIAEVQARQKKARRTANA
jgi:DNA-binding transcriptional regulator YdaS (Cro superfamily)